MIAVVNKDLKLLVKPETLSLLTRIESFFAGQNIQAFVVGGFVRDLLLERDTADIDIALTADAPEVARKLATALGGKYIPLDEAGRVGRVVIDRSKDPSDTTMWQLDFSTAGDGILEDLKRRDFTIDAMAIDLRMITRPQATTGEQLLNEAEITAELIDPSNGLSDLRQRVVRAVSETVFQSDALRLLRAVRLAAELGFNINRKTEDLIKHHAHLLSGVAGERIRYELLRLLAPPKAAELLLYLDDLGLLTALIPELTETKEIDQPREHTWDVFNHSVKSVAAAEFVLRQGDWQYADREVLKLVPWSTELSEHFNERVSSLSTRRSLLKLAALLHDIAKPQTKIIDERGRMRFFGHPMEGAPIAARILERLRFSSKEVKLIAGIIRHHLRPVQISRDELPSRRAVYRYFRDTGDVAIDALFFSLADHLATRGPDLDMANWRQHAAVVDYVLRQRSEQKDVVSPPKLIDGHDLISTLNLKPGPELGQLLEAVREAQAAGEVSSKEEALSYVDKLLKRNQKEPEETD